MAGGATLDRPIILDRDGRRGEDPAHQVCQAADERRMRADSRRALIEGYAAFFGEMAVFDIELDQSLGMLRHEGQRIERDRLAVTASARDLVDRRRTYPLQPPE